MRWKAERADYYYYYGGSDIYSTWSIIAGIYLDGAYMDSLERSLKEFVTTLKLRFA